MEILLTVNIYFVTKKELLVKFLKGGDFIFQGLKTGEPIA